MAETTTTVPDAPTGTEVRVVTVPAAASPGGGVQQVATLGDPTDGSLQKIRTSGAIDVNIAQSVGNMAITSGQLTGSGISVTASTANAGNVGFAIAGGTYTNLPIIFEATLDGTNWFAITAVRTDRSVINSAVTLASAGVYYWNAECTAYISVRLRQTAAATAQTANPTVIVAQGPLLYDPSPVSTEAQPDTATQSSVTSSATAVTALNANVRRRAASIYNDGTATMYVSLGSTASLTNFTAQVPPEGLYELPFPCYTGLISLIWSAANGAARVTELTS